MYIFVILIYKWAVLRQGRRDMRMKKKKMKNYIPRKHWSTRGRHTQFNSHHRRLFTVYYTYRIIVIMLRHNVSAKKQFSARFSKKCVQHEPRRLRSSFQRLYLHTDSGHRTYMYILHCINQLIL